jgi:hypothetical protein
MYCTGIFRKTSFRIESKVFLLQGMGSDGLYYTQDQVRGIIAHAHDRAFVCARV